MTDIKRDIQNSICAHIKPQKAVLIYGARRVVKTVLLKHITQQFKGKVEKLNGESFDTQIMLRDKTINNYRHLFGNLDLLIIDEAQHIPDIGNILKLMVDEVENLCVIATGSSAFDLKNQIGNPLVGRSTTFILPPFSQSEISQHESPIETIRNLEERLIYGSYPEVINIKDYNLKREYLLDIVDAYLLKDILAVDGIKNSDKMYNLLRLIAYQQGNIVSYDELAKQLGMNRNTVERYLDLLQKVFVIYHLGGYSRNLRKEIGKANKWYFCDNGIRNAVIRNFQPLALRQDSDRGSLWENYIITERIKDSSNFHLPISYYFWRTYDNQEIDLIEENNTELKAFEIKANKTNVKAPIGFSKTYQEASFTLINKDNYLNYIKH